MIRVAVAALLLTQLVTVMGCESCRRPSVQPDAGSTSDAPATPGSATAGETLLLERFLSARAREDGPLGTIELAAIGRDRTVVLARLDANLRVREKKILATDVEATEPTEIALVGDGLVVVVGKLGQERSAFLLRAGKPLLPIGIDRCLLRDGVAWIERAAATFRVRIVRGAVDSTSATYAAPAESEVRVACGPDAATASVRDGEHLSLVTIAAEAGGSPALAEVEREEELDDELRDRVILPRAQKNVVVLRIGTDSVRIRELDAKGLGAWVKTKNAKGGDASLADDVDVVEAHVAPSAGGDVFLLTSEPIAGPSCPDGDPPRRIVLHRYRGPTKTDERRPIVELPCGLDAIRAHLEANDTRATMWWTEPVDAKTCTHPGLTTSAIVTAASDAPGAKRTAILAEGVFPLGDGRFLAVTRPSGCVPWAAPGNGVLTWAK